MHLRSKSPLRLKVRFIERPSSVCSSIFLVGFKIDVPRGASPFIGEEKLPEELFLSLFYPDRNSSIATRETIATRRQQQRQQPSRTRRFHNRPIATRLSISSLGILLTTVAPLPALIRQLVVSWLLARTAASYQRNHTVLFAPGRECLSSRQHRNNI